LVAAAAASVQYSRTEEPHSIRLHIETESPVDKKKDHSQNQMLDRMTTCNHISLEIYDKHRKTLIATYGAVK